MYSILYPSIGMAALAALWFGLVALRGRRGWPGWAITGWFIGLVTAGTCLGFARAISIPLSDAQQTKDFALGIAAALAVLALIGALATTPLRRRKTEQA
jgi:hypothetical protein